MINVKYLYRLFLLVLFVGFLGLFSCNSNQTVCISIITNNHLEIEQLRGKSGEKTNFEMPVLEDSVFEGFYTDEKFVHYFGKTIREFPDKDITLYAKYTSKGLYKLSFDTVGGSTIASYDVFDGEILESFTPLPPQKFGYMFDGWVTDVTSQELFDFRSLMPPSNFTLYAKWSRDSSKVFYRFMLDGKVYKELPLEVGDVLNLPYEPKMDSNYIFDGWYTNNTVATKYVFGNRVDFGLNNTFVDEEGVYCIYANYYSKGLVIDGSSIVGYNGLGTNVMTPWVFNNTLIDKISDGAFEYKKIKSIVVADTIKQIGERAFYGCTALQSANLPSDLEFIGDEAFAGCTLLEQIRIPKQAFVSMDNVFNACNRLTNIVVEEGNQHYLSYLGGVYSIDGKTLIKCAPGLSEFFVRDGTTSIEKSAFDSEILRKLSIPNSVSFIERGAIRYETSFLQEISLPAVANSGYAKNGSIVPIFNLATIFGAKNYLDNTSSSIYLSSLFVPHSLVSVNITEIKAELSYSFYGCFYIKEIILPQKGVSYIGAGAFFLCYSLEEIIIPSSVTGISGGSVQDAAFYYCNNLKKITIPFLSGGYLSYIFGASDYSEALSIGGMLVPFTFYLEEVTLSSKDIVELGNGAFYGNKSLKRINTGSKIKKIGYDCFYDNNHLEQIDGLEFVEELDINNSDDRYSGAFAYCHSLKNFALPSLSKGVIGKDAFIGVGIWSGAISFKVGDGVQALEDFAFMDCSTLVSIEISSTVRYIGVGTFYNCISIKNLVIPKEVNAISPSAFEKCNSLESLTLPVHNNVEYINQNNESTLTFYFPLYFGSMNITGNRYKSNAGDLYYVPRSLKVVSFNYAADDVCLEYTFFNCEFIETVNFCESISSIGENAFYGCTSLKSLTLSRQIKRIDSGAFAYCRGLIEFTVGANSHFNVTDGVLYSADKSKLICYPAGKRGDVFSVIEGVTHIEAFAFAGSRFLKNVELPSSLISVGSSIFQNCSALNSVTAQSGIFDAEMLNIGMLVGKTDNILYAYFGLAEIVVIPSKITAIAPYVFCSLEYLQKVVIGKNVLRIGRFAFSGVTAMVEFDADALITVLDAYSFNGYLGKSIEFPETLKKIDSHAFENSALQSIAFPKKLISIEEFAFWGSQSLSEITFDPQSELQSIGTAAFAQCSIKSFVIPPNLTSIGDHAFAYNKLEVFDSLSSNLEYIGKYSFYSNSLQIIKITGKINTICEGAFESNAQLSDLFIGEGVKFIDAYAFSADTTVLGETAPLSMLSAINIPSSVEQIGNMAFFGAGHYAIPSGGEGIYWYFTKEVKLTFATGSQLTEIGDNAFGMIKLSELIDLSMTKLHTIGAFAFSNFINSNISYVDASIREIILPNSLKIIKEGAFFAQSGLREVILPSEIEQIGDRSFYLCDSLIYVIIQAEIPPIAGINCFEQAVQIYVHDSSFAAYTESQDWQGYLTHLRMMSALSEEQEVLFGTGL